jgi:hypothetical protein
VLSHPLHYDVEEKVAVVHEFVHHQEVGVVGVEDDGQVLAHLFVHGDAPLAERRHEHVFDVRLQGLLAPGLVHHVDQIDEDPHHVQADLFAAGRHQQGEQLVEEGRQECYQRGELDGVQRLQDLASFGFGGQRRRFGVEEALGVDEQVKEVLVFGVDGGVEVEADGEDWFLSVYPGDLGTCILHRCISKKRSSSADDLPLSLGRTGAPPGTPGAGAPPPVRSARPRSACPSATAATTRTPRSSQSRSLSSSWYRRRCGKK